ncbi:hypothetical protein EYF80_015844 [Liparis tanakae]|uniref:Uncharacterized protein n=1 Tax=Liparis tanakae TaxID=230148 RepID=A0A4Z2I708_9TELE|nr:hypothetical protein EYF80_015844 [Liparis tanakae]
MRRRADPGVRAVITELRSAVSDRGQSVRRSTPPSPAFEHFVPTSDTSEPSGGPGSSAAVLASRDPY